MHRSKPRALAHIVAAAAFTFAAAGCGGGDDSGGGDAGGPNVSDPSSTQTGGSVSAGGSLRIAFAGPSTTLDPHKPTISTYPTYDYPIYDRLFQIDSADNVLPMLATSLEFSADGSSATIRLRDDVTFHDGSPVDAAAVKGSLERGKTVEGSTVATSLAGITSIEAVDPTTVTLALDGIGAELSAVLATNAGAVLNPAVFNDPSVDLDTAPPPGAGSGPYVVTASVPSAETSYERAPSYWDPSAGLLSGFTLAFVPAVETRLSGLRAGDFDLVHVTSDAIEQARADVDAGDYEMLTQPAATQDLLFNVESGDLADPVVREAISMAINREDIRQVYPCVENTQPVPSDNWAYNPDIHNEYDPEAAKALIDERGGASIELTHYSSGGSTEVLATVLQAQLGEVGIDVALRALPPPDVFSGFAAGELQAVITTIPIGADPVEALARTFVGGLNVARGSFAAELTELAAPGANPALSQEERAPIYRDVFQYIADNDLYVPLCRGEQGWAHTAPVVGLDTMVGFNKGIPVLTQLGVGSS